MNVNERESVGEAIKWKAGVSMQGQVDYTGGVAGLNQTELQSPHSPRPQLDHLGRFPLFCEVDFDTIPPAFASGLPPEEQEFLRCGHLVVIDGHRAITMCDAGLE